jgi:nucleotidyltransferase/DNA polymerase involved in DNA repair
VITTSPMVKTVNPEDVIAFLEGLPIRKFYGVGKVTTEKCINWNIYRVELKVEFLETFWKIRLLLQCRRNS